MKSYPARARTWTEGIKIPCATITLPGNNRGVVYLNLKVILGSGGGSDQMDARHKPGYSRSAGSIATDSPRHRHTNNKAA